MVNLFVLFVAVKYVYPSLLLLAMNTEDIALD